MKFTIKIRATAAGLIATAAIAAALIGPSVAQAQSHRHVYPNKHHRLVVTAQRAERVTKRTLHHDWHIRGSILAFCGRHGTHRGSCDFLFQGRSGASYCGSSRVPATRRYVINRYDISRRHCGEF